MFRNYTNFLGSAAAQTRFLGSTAAQARCSQLLPLKLNASLLQVPSLIALSLIALIAPSLNPLHGQPNLKPPSAKFPCPWKIERASF